MKTKKWVMPKWMEKYRSLINNTGGNSVEELMNSDDTKASYNVILSALICCVESQITLLHRLHNEGLLK
jgi:hypothetical protein